nr:uncharacterized protein LOC122272946 isoform X2 [Parasteatoda tepidariorum]
MQPLDVAVYSAFKMKYRIAQNNWMTNNPGKTMSIYNIAKLSNEAFTFGFSKENIISSFNRTGIYPYNSEIFSNTDFLAALVTDRPIASEVPTEPCSSLSGPPEEISVCSQSPLTGIRPYPKASPRKAGRKGRKRGRCRVLTDTPEKLVIEQQEMAKVKKFRVSKSKKPRKGFKRLQFSSSESDVDDPVYSNSTDDEINMDYDPVLDSLEKDINIGDYLLTRVAGKKAIHFYISEVLNVSSKDEFEVKFLKRVGANKFVHGNEISDILLSDVECKLPQPISTGGSERQITQLSFQVDFNSYNVK